jgi:formylglycine-generating enzyme required for sulfatase activity
LTVTTADFTAFEFAVVTVNEAGDEVSRETKQGQVFREAIGDSLLEMLPIPGGEFMMGQTEAEKEELIRLVGEDDYQRYYADELPQHQVTVPSFLLGKYPVTQSQYQAVMGKNPSSFTENGTNRPVERVSWDDAVAFCQQLSKQTGREYRLPSEAEWEYACRAGTTTPFHFGPTITTDLANYNGNFTYGSGPKGQFREQTTAVGSFPANAFDLYDLHGNVWEWCLDHWHDSYNGAPTDGSAWLSSDDNAARLLRGGSWFNFPWYCRSANRLRFARDVTNGSIGFRVVCASSWALS